jgi:hypothetical protein
VLKVKIKLRPFFKQTRIQFVDGESWTWHIPAEAIYDANGKWIVTTSTSSMIDPNAYKAAYERNNFTLPTIEQVDEFQ